MPSKYRLTTDLFDRETRGPLPIRERSVATFAPAGSSGADAVKKQIEAASSRSGAGEERAGAKRQDSAHALGNKLTRRNHPNADVEL